MLPVAGDLLLRACPEQFPSLNSGLNIPGRQDRGSECPLGGRTPRRHHVLLPCFTWLHHLFPSVMLFLPSQSDNSKNKQGILVMAAAVSVSLACGMKTISTWLYISFRSQRFDLTSLAVHISWQKQVRCLSNTLSQNCVQIICSSFGDLAFCPGKVRVC